ncbi:Do family serine endopeptidase [Caulobacter sp. KR2-114]|uniref:Do family serine endopeptidase n=1 Tax=Caulobacter sp. KR2-114 TaxID=3400912 RepID=UPI003C09D477
MAVRKYQFFVGALAGVGVAVAAAAGVGVRLPAAAADTHGRLMLASTSPVFAPAPGAPQSFADIFEKVSPAVVSINVTSHIPVAQQNPALKGFPFNIVPPNGGGGDDDGDDNSGGASPNPRGQKALSAGSGFFISPDGYIVTNNHVVENADDIKVVMKDGSTLKATVVGRDEGTDLAVIKVEGHNFAYVDFENNARPRVGDWVLAVGNPFSLGSTATAGIVSAYGRDIGETFVDYIQIDAPINRGNSGGPTFDTYGRVIGVNTAIFSPSGGSVGIGFAIPADVADNITKQLIAGGKITRGYIGATIQNLSDEMAESWGLKGRKGAVVADLVPNGPASRGGLQQGDVVVAVNGHNVTTSSEMTREVAKAKAGDTLHLDVYRDGKQRTVDIKSGTRPSEAQLAQNGGAGGDDSDSGGSAAGPKVGAKAQVLGMSLTPLDPVARRQYGIDDAVRGVLVDGVKGSSDAGEKGLRRGDVIVRAGGHEVASASDVAAAVAEWRKSGRTSIPLGISRGGRTLFLPVKIDEAAKGDG